MTIIHPIHPIPNHYAISVMLFVYTIQCPALVSEGDFIQNLLKSQALSLILSTGEFVEKRAVERRQLWTCEFRGERTELLCSPLRYHCQRIYSCIIKSTSSLTPRIDPTAPSAASVASGRPAVAACNKKQAPLFPSANFCRLKTPSVISDRSTPA